MLSSLVGMLCLFGLPPEPLQRPAYLFQAQTGPDHKTHFTSQSYHAQPGDIVLFDDHSSLMAKLYNCCGSGKPLHAAIIFRKDDGSLATLEAGTNAVMKVFNFDLDPRLHGFDGTILVRRLHKPLSPEQTKQLTEFALAQEGKPYALGRFMLQGTPFRPHNDLLTPFFGRTVVDRDRWICSELVVAAIASAGVWPPEDFPANAMLPRDLCYDERFDLSAYYQAPALWQPHAEVQTEGDGVVVGKSRK